MNRFRLLLPFVLLSLIALSPAVAQDVDLLQTIGASGSLNGQFTQPHNVAIDTQGNLYVADHHNHRVQKFGPRGDFLLSFGVPGSGPGEFQNPIGLVTDLQDNVYVTEVGNHRVQVFDSSGIFQNQWGGLGTANGQFDFPADLARNSSQEIWVVDRNNSRVQRFSSGGTHRASFGSPGSGNGQFNQPTGIGISPNNGDIYIADKDNNRVQKFDSGFNFLLAFGTAGTGLGEFDRPTDVAVSADGARIFVLDAGNRRVQVFDRDGNALGGFGTGDVPLTFPRGIIINNNRIFVADRLADRVFVLRDIERTMQNIQRSNDQQEEERFADALAVSGNRMVVGVPGVTGMVEVYRRDGNNMVLEEQVTPPTDMTTADFGASVEIVGDIMIVGAPGRDGTSQKIGAGVLQAAVYQRTLTNWDFKTGLSSPSQTPGDQFGAAVAMSGNMVAVGAPMDSGGVGAVYVFELDLTDFSFTEMGQVFPGGPGGKGGAFGAFGAALSFKNGIMAVGAPGGALANSVAGSVSIFNAIQNNLQTPVNVFRGMNETGDTFGTSVSLDQGTLLTGAPAQNQSTGAAYAYPNVLAQAATGFQIPTPVGVDLGSRFGASVSLMQGAAIIGSPGVFVGPPGGKGLSSGASYSFSLGADGAAGGTPETAPASGVCGKVDRKGCNIPGVENYGESSALGERLSVIGAPSRTDADAFVFVEFDPEFVFTSGGFED